MDENKYFRLSLVLKRPEMFVFDSPKLGSGIPIWCPDGRIWGTDRSGGGKKKGSLHGNNLPLSSGHGYEVVSLLLARLELAKNEEGGGPNGKNCLQWGFVDRQTDTAIHLTALPKNKGTLSPSCSSSCTESLSKPRAATILIRKDWKSSKKNCCFL